MHINFLNTFIICISLLSVVSCTPVENKDEVVEVLNDGIYEPVSFSVVGGLDRGEFLIGGSSDQITIQVRNNSKYSLTDMYLFLEDDSTAGVIYNPTDEGKSVAPGFGGTCTSTLLPKKSCTFILLYKPTLPGELFQNVRFTYKNVIENLSSIHKLLFVAGEAASLIFEGEQINYSFGVVERTERTKYSNKLVIQNTGGLTAKNLVFSKLDSPASNAYTILSNNCPTNIKPGEKCEIEVGFETMNYDGTAPDGNNEVNYTSAIKYDYVRDPENGKSALTAYYSTLATTIEGKIKSSGASSISFSQLTVGNIGEVNIKITNQGYKEAILREINLRDSSNSLKARCFRDGSSSLICRDPSDTMDLPLYDNPFKIVDTSNCMSEKSQLNYTFDESGAASTSVRLVSARTDDAPGESCFFRVKFHPSVSYTSAGNFNDYRINVVFDSTWKNNSTIYNNLSSDSNNFRITEAPYVAAAKLEFNTFEFDKIARTNIDSADNDLFVYDVGRISLITSPTYKKIMKFKIKNISETLAEVLSITDGGSPKKILTDTSSNINNYYRAASHSCSYLSPLGGQCDLVMDFTALASTNSDSSLAQIEENNYMYDDQDDIMTRHKKFIITYKDGTTYNDDMTLREPRVVEARMRGLLVRKGQLAFGDATMTAGTSSANTFISGTTGFFYLVLKNIGTGPIPFFEATTNLPGMPSPFTPATAMFPYAYFDEPISTGRSGADYDCYDLMGLGGSISVTPNDGSYNMPAVLDAGKSCSLTFKFNLNNNDKINLTNSNDTRTKWEYGYLGDDAGSVNLWNFKNYIGTNTPIQINYFDGDGVIDAGTGYSPDTNGYGTRYYLDDYNIKVRFNKPAKIVPIAPTPFISSILWRQDYTLPAYTIDSATEWGSNLAATSINSLIVDNSFNTSAVPVSYRASSTTNFNAKNFSNSNYDYILHAGTFKAGKTYKIGFQIKNFGQGTSSSMTNTLTGGPEFSIAAGVATTLNGGAAKNLTFNFTPNAAGVYTTDYVISYNNGQKELTDINSVTYANVTKNVVIQIVAEAVDAADENIALTSKEYEVSYDSVLDTFNETLMPTEKTHNYLYDDFNPTAGEQLTLKAIRGSKLYALKQFVFKNNSSLALADVNFFIKASVGSTISENTGAGVGYSIKSTTCNGTVAAGSTCTVDIKFKASDAELSSSVRYGFFSYKIANNQYRSIGVKLEFNASDPAKLKVGTINPININDSFGNVIQNSYGIAFGQYADATHPVLNAYPSGTMLKTQQITNLSSEKASFLKQYRNYVGNQAADIPAGAYHEIYNDGKIQVELSRACFYGDDEGSALDPSEWGFNNTSVNDCYIKFYYTYNDDHIGQKIPSSLNNVNLAFYDNLRASFDNINLHVDGFVEPNASFASETDIKSVVSESDGSLSFEWGAFSEQNSSWGSIYGYRVYYSTTTSVFNNIYEASGVSFQDVVTTSAEFTGLIPGKYYYFLIVGLRTTPSGKNFISLPSNMTKREIVIPPTGTIYDYSLKAIVDMFSSPEGNPEYGTKAQADTNCTSKTRILSKNGVNVTKYKKLINSTIYDLINSDEGGNSNYNYKISPHWLADDQVDIATVFTDLDCSQQSGSDGDNTYYQKSCNDCSCNNLSQAIGGDGVDFPYAGHLFVEDNFVGAARCYVSQ